MLKSKSWLIAKIGTGLARLLKTRIFWIVLVAVLGLGYRFYVEYNAILREPVQSWSENQTADCAVVLTGGAGRVREGFDLLARQSVKKLIISGVYSNARLREIFPLWPLYGNLTENDVVLEKRSETTYGNAQQSLAIVEALKCRDVILITSRTHMRRAYQTFRSAFPENIFLHRDSVIGTRYEPSAWETSVEATKAMFYSIFAY